MKKSTKLLSLSLALNFLVPTYAFASSNGQDEMEKHIKPPPTVRSFAEGTCLLSRTDNCFDSVSCPLNYTSEFFDFTYKPLYKNAIKEIRKGNTDVLVIYAKIMRTAYEEALYYGDQENQIWFKDEINAFCQELEIINFKFVIVFLTAFAHDLRYQVPITKDEKNHYQVYFGSPSECLVIEFSSEDKFYKVELKHDIT